jgi:hypothetical protein
MITKDNLSEILNFLTKEQIENVFESNCDHVCLWLGGYGNIYFDPIPNNCFEQGEQMANDTGGIFCDKDTFLTLFKESDSINPFLIQLI